MKINFFEEFPTKKNLNKVRLINFHSLLFIAAKNLKEFHQHEKYVKVVNKKIEVGYWPVLSKRESYWLSPFSDTKGLKKIIEDLNKEKKELTVLWDCEFPLNKKLLLLSPKRFLSNKKMIATFLRNTKHDTYTAEDAVVPLFKVFFEIFGLDFSFLDKKIFMAYTSLVKGPLKGLYRNVIKRCPLVGLGTIAKGVHGNEPILTFEGLESDLRLAKESGVKEVFIFRLGGLNKLYMKIIERYIN